MTAEPKLDSERCLTDRLVAPVANSARLEVLRVFSYRTASPNEVAKELGKTLASIAYHVKVLKEFGCIEAVKERPVRGATEHFYRATVPPHFEDDEWEKLPPTTREEISCMVFRALLGEVLRALRHQTFDARADRHLSWVPMELDEQGWKELVAKQLETLEEEQRIKVESAKRLCASGKSGQRVVAAMLAFETPPGFGFLPSHH